MWRSVSRICAWKTLISEPPYPSPALQHPRQFEKQVGAGGFFFPNPACIYGPRLKVCSMETLQLAPLLSCISPLAMTKEMAAWRRKWQPTPVLLPRESHGQRSLAGYSPYTEIIILFAFTHTSSHLLITSNCLFLVLESCSSQWP